MSRPALTLAVALALCASTRAGDPERPAFDTRTLAGWTLQVNRALLLTNAAATEHAIDLLKAQLEEIVRVVPAPAVAELRKVPLWLSPEYPGVIPRAEYHPNAAWLREHGRNPDMAKGVEFTNVRIFDAEIRRMPNFALHELAHAYQDRVLTHDASREALRAAYERAQAGGTYDRVERRNSEGRKSMDRAYAMTNPQEYFAESTEAFFTRNDFFPFNHSELMQHDPEMGRLLAKLWGVADAAPAGPGVAGRLPAASRTSLGDHLARPFVFADPGFYQWGGTPIRGDDGLFHFFYDRWPRDNPRGMYGWLYITEIAHATAEKPEGSYVFRNVALCSPGDNPTGRWDAVNTHNACITRFPDPATGRLRYFLYFIANRGQKTMSDPWLVHVMNQRIGVAWSDSPDGPWTRHPGPVCEPGGPLQHYVVNPGVTRLPDGRYLMVLKGRGAVPGQPNKPGPMLHGWALAEKPTGPFVIQPTLLFPGSITAEDPCVWVQDGRVFAAVKDWDGKLSGTPGISWLYGDLLPDGGLAWKVPPRSSLSGRALKWDDGTETKVYALERPFVLLDAQGHPSHLYAACCQASEFGTSSQTPQHPPRPVKPENLPFNVCIPLLPAAETDEGK